MARRSRRSPRFSASACAVADKRADFDLQISFMTEHELTKLANVVIAIADYMGLATAHDPVLDEIEQDVAS